MLNLIFDTSQFADENHAVYSKKNDNAADQNVLDFMFLVIVIGFLMHDLTSFQIDL